MNNPITGNIGIIAEKIDSLLVRAYSQGIAEGLRRAADYAISENIGGEFSNFLSDTAVEVEKQVDSGVKAV